MVSCHYFPGLQSCKKTIQIILTLLQLMHPLIFWYLRMIIILHMMCKDFDHLTQQRSVFFSSNFHVHLFSVSASRQMRWVDVVEVGRDLIGIWARILQAKKHKENWVYLHFFAKICMLMHPVASLFDVDDDFQRCFIFTLSLMSFITADAFNCEEFNHCTSTWYLAE